MSCLIQRSLEYNCESFLPEGARHFSHRGLSIGVGEQRDFPLPLRLFRLMTGCPAAHYFLSEAGLKAGVMRQTAAFISFLVSGSDDGGFSSSCLCSAHTSAYIDVYHKLDTGFC